MKRTVFFILIILVGIQLDVSGQKKRDRYKVKADTISVDSLEYKLIVLDPGFDTWLITQPPENFYSMEYYKQRNRIYVAEWNYRFMNSRNNGKYETYIYYDPNVDYGLDLNYKLYYYFKYFEETNKVRLYPSVR